MGTSLLLLLPNNLLKELTAIETKETRNEKEKKKFGLYMHRFM